MILTRLFKEFFSSERSGGLILIIVTFISLVFSNTLLQSEYISFWNTGIGENSIIHWINDGLMTLFFLLIGLELEREIYFGELSNFKKASLPFFAAVGGMIIPAGIYIAFNLGTGQLSGAGIPTATDIAFAIGILSLLGRHVPASLKIFLTALAVIDDLGAIIIISLFYTGSLILGNLFLALGVFGLLLILNKLGIKTLIPYILGGIVMWYFMEHSGVHPTISGVLLAFAIPFGDGGDRSPSFRLQHYLHKPVAIFVLPLFAAANTALSLDFANFKGIFSAYGLGIIAGLVVGKPLGILLFTFFSVKLKISDIPEDLNWSVIAGAGMLGGIGFTMSIFISLLAFNDALMINNSKLAILIGSIIAGTAGFFWLKSKLESGFNKN